MTPHPRLATALAFLLVAATAHAAEPEAPQPELERLSEEVFATAAVLRDRALAESDAYDFVADLTLEVGPRSAGSEGDRRGVAWALERLRAMGLENVHAEPVTVPRWERGHAAGRIVSPFPHRVVLVALGGSVGTVEGGITAEVVELPGLEELEAADPATIAGKIVYLSGRMERSPFGETYGPAVAKRGHGPAVAAERGAVAVLIRSVGTSTDRIAHTGATRYREGVPAIPAAALSNPDADLLSAMIARGEPVRFHLELGSRRLGEAQSANVIAEVPGRERPEEIVLLAAHLDSWDLGTGAMDDGAGCAIVAETARILAALPERPRRTVRVLLAANEEFGLSGATAYGELHAEEMARHVVALESDFGLGAVNALRSKLTAADLPLAADLARLVAPLGVPYQGNLAYGGADLRPVMAAGVPVFDLPQDATRYFDYHHTANDVLAILDPDAMRQNVAAYVAVTYALAEMEGGLERVPVEEEDGH